MPKSILISLPIPVIEELDREAKERDITRSNVIRERLGIKARAKRSDSAPTSGEKSTRRVKPSPGDDILANIG